MRNMSSGSPLDWQEALRRAAAGAVAESHRSTWLVRLAGLATVAFVLMLVGLPGGWGLSSRGLDDVRQVADQAQRLTSGTLSTDGIYPLLYPLWLLIAARFTNDLALAARLLSGIGAVAALFLVYQLCHGLADQQRSNEQSCFALLTLALTPTFFLAAAGGGTELPHLALLLMTLLAIQRGLLARDELVPMALAGLFLGLSLLIRPSSILVLPAAFLWLWISRPFGTDEQGTNLRAGLGLSAGFMVGSAPRLLLNLTQSASIVPLDEASRLGARLLANPLGLLGSSAVTLWQFVTADDAERFSAIGGAWQAGAWGGMVGALIALAPTIVKALGLLGLFTLCVFERFESAIDRARLPAIFVLLLAVGSALALVDERSTLAIETILIVFAFAGLPSVVPGMFGGMLGLGLVVLMVFHVFGSGPAIQHAATFRANDQIAEALQAAGARPSQVMSANWAFYDTRSAWRERYRHIPSYVNSLDDLVKELKREGARYLVFDRQVGADQWPRLASLMESERPPAGLRPLRSPIRTDESPPNAVVIYKLE